MKFITTNISMLFLLSLSTTTTLASYVRGSNGSVHGIVADTNELQTDDVPGLIAALNDPTAAAIRAEIDSNSTQLAAIVADTNEGMKRGWRGTAIGSFLGFFVGILPAAGATPGSLMSCR